MNLAWSLIAPGGSCVIGYRAWAEVRVWKRQMPLPTHYRRGVAALLARNQQKM